jgi:hypothetical protein
MNPILTCDLGSTDQGMNDFSFHVVGVFGKPEGKRPLGRPRRRCVDNIKMDLTEIGFWMLQTGLIWLRIETSGGLL